jgi:glycine hydroxymethyltransferase
MTTRGLQEADFDQIADFLHCGCQLALQAQQIATLEATQQAEEGGKKKVLLKDFVRVLDNNDEMQQGIQELKQQVEAFALQFPMPGDEQSS